MLHLEELKSKNKQNMVLFIPEWKALECKFKARLALKYVTGQSLSNLFIRCTGPYLQVKVLSKFIIFDW